MKKKKWQLAAVSVIAIALISGTKAEARDDAYRVPQLSGVTKTWVYQGETFDRNWDRMLADDQEDGDLTKMLSSSGTVDTSKTGTYTLTRKVQDLDGNVASLDTQVTVLDKNTATEEEKTVQRTLYTLPNADHLTGISFNRGYYHDRQNLGIWMPQGSSIQIRIVNAETFKEDLTIQFENDDSQTESSAKIPADGSWVTLSNTKMVDSVPFITTPKRTTVQPVVEYKYTDALKEIPYYRYGDSQQAFFDAWDESQAPFAIIEGSAATFLVPVCDKDNIINSSYGNKKDVYRFKTLDEMLEWYAAFVKQYDAYAGLDFDAKEPWNQNVRAKFFIKANAHGAGQAYYSKDHSAYNGKSLDTYLVRDWLSLHEFGHGYEGAIAAQENPFVETTNNILGYYFEPTYRPEEDFGWLLENFTGTKAQRYAQLGQRMKNRLDTTNTFADIVEGGNYYNVSLYMFTNLMNKLGPQKAVSAMHSYYRQVYYLTGKKMASSDALAESLDTLGYNVLPYFKAWHIVPSGKVEDKIYAMDKPMLYFLKELIPDDTACETTRVQLGLEGIYSLVSTDDLSATGYISQVSMDVQIDDLEQVKGKKIQIKNGDKVVKELTISDSRVTCELPVGIYKVEMPSPKSNIYQYGNEYLVASAGNVSKTLVYTKQSGNPLADDAQIQLLGLGDALVATVKVDTVSQKLIWTLSSTTPHMYIDGTYISIRVLSPDGKELYSQELQGKQKTEKSNLKVDFPVGSKLILYHRESKGRQRFMSSYTGEILSDYQIAESGQTTTYLMTEKGLMQSDWKNEKQMNVYARTLSQYSQYLFENMTREEIAESSQYHNQITTILLAYEKLDEDAKKAYQRQYGILIGMEPEEAYAYAMIENSHLTAMADSEHPGEGASLALDGDTSTIWHSNYGNGIKADIAGNKNNTYTILLDGNMDIGKLAYLPRQGGNNGTILKYELSYSTTASGDDFQTISIKDNTWANDQKQKEVTFDAPSARRIRIRALSTAGNPADTYISAAQFYLYEKYSIYAKKTYLSDLYQTPDEKGNTVNTDKNADGTEISLLVNGTERNFEKGIGLKTGESALWDLSGLGSNSLSFLAGIKAGENASAIVEVYGDGQLLYTTQTLKAGENAEDVYLDISNIKVLKICAVSENRNVQVALADVKLGNAADKEALSLKIGDQAVFLRNNALAPEDRGKAVFKSSNDAVVSVNEKGVVTAVAAGTAEVTADFGKEKVTCQITVTEKTKPEEKPDESVRAELAEAVASEEYKAVYDSGNTDGSYTESSWKAYKKAYENALNPDEKASEEELKELLRKLQEARAGLKTVKKEAEEKLAEAVASEEYKTVYDRGNTDGSYTESSWEAYKKAYENALNPDEKASEEDLKELLSKLQEARAGLKTVKKEAEEKLAEAVASEEYKTVYDRGNTDGSYTESSWKAYKKAYENALNPDEKASEEELKELLRKLQEARAGLKTVKKEAEEKLAEAVASEEYKTVYDRGNTDGSYTESSWEAYKKAYENALNPDEKASEEDLKELLSKLQEARAGLKTVKKEAEEKLAEAVASEEYKTVYDRGNTDGSYTESSWEAYKKAYENALNPDEKASEEDLKELLSKLQEARAGLKTAGGEVPSEAPTEKPTETQPASGTPSTPAPEVTKTDQTVRGNVIYRILDEKKKTAAVIGAGGNKGKNVTSVTIAKTVNINGVTYKVVQIGKNAFKGCKKLKKVTIGSNIKKIGGSAFVNCSKLKTINMKKANGITSIGSKAFRKINANAKVTVPAKKFKKYSKMLKRAGLPKKAGIKK